MFRSLWLASVVYVLLRLRSLLVCTLGTGTPEHMQRAVERAGHGQCSHKGTCRHHAASPVTVAVLASLSVFTEGSLLVPSRADCYTSYRLTGSRLTVDLRASPDAQGCRVPCLLYASTVVWCAESGWLAGFADALIGYFQAGIDATIGIQPVYVLSTTTADCGVLAMFESSQQRQTAKVSRSCYRQPTGAMDSRRVAQGLRPDRV